MKMNAEQVRRLLKTQNHPVNVNQDIMTFTAFFTTEDEVENHIKGYEQRAEKFNSLTEKQRKGYLKGKYVTLEQAAAA